MSTALAMFHGPFGRVGLCRLNKPLAPHAHREGHLVLLIKGTPAVVTIDGAPHTIDQGQAVAISPWEPHAFLPGDLGEGGLFLTLYITPRWFIEMSRDAGLVMHFGARQVELDARLQQLAREAADLLVDGQTRARFAFLLYDLTVACFDRSWDGAQERRAASRPRISDFRIRNAMRLMNERVVDDCVLDRIARDAGLSRPHFYKLFRQHIGLTPNMYLNTLRLERSIHRLIRSADPVTSIGLDLGFASQASFTRFFCNNIGMSPTDYRRASFVAA